MAKRHNAKLCPLAIGERIINALAAGDSKRAIARALGVSNNTVTAIAEQEWHQVKARKARIAAQAERAATSAFDRINNKLDSPDDIPLNILVPVAGVSVDKFIALRGDPSFVAKIEPFPAATSSKPTLNSHVRSQNAQQQLKPSNPPPLNWLCQTVRRVRIPKRGDPSSKQQESD